MMYGATPFGIANAIGCSEQVGKELYSRVETKFKTAVEWLNALEEKAKTEVMFDYFQRPRRFKPEEPHLVRNFVVQSVAATVCQEKLIALNSALENHKARLVFSVHDGFGAITEVAAARDTYRVMKDTLESDSKLCPNLSMKVEIKFGVRLDSLKVFWKD